VDNFLANFAFRNNLSWGDNMIKKNYLLFVFLLAFFYSCEKPVDEIHNTNNGYRTTIGTGDDQIIVVVVNGSPYEMGKALGQLLKNDINACLTGFLDYGRNGAPDRFNNQNLDAAWQSVSPYTDKRFKEELKGLAEGSGLPLIDLRRAHMIPVLGDYACSGVAVWGDASADGHLYQIRNLDFTMAGHLQDYPTIVIYLPDDGIAHAVPTFSGYIGAHAGMNVKGIALSEKGASPGSDYPFDMEGTHFSTLFRDILYDADDLNEALEMVNATKLIKRYRFWIGDGKKETMGAAKILVSSPDPVKLTIWKNNDPSDEQAPHLVKNTIYYTMKNDLAYAHLSSNAGSYDATKMIELSKIVADDDGNLINVVYDATDLEMWVSFAEDMQVASEREYVYLNLKDYLK
jgi:isopenicillin-N N-acyltransferase-like protein